jgi:hypothetical protein
VRSWAESVGVAIEDYDYRMQDDHAADGLLLINENHDIPRELFDMHTHFDQRHIPTQKIDVNGTLQVAISSLDMWLRNYKCKNVLILGADELLNNDNWDRFFERVKP